jgi:LPXTG-motif cell wall-anchored protein
LQGTVHVGSTPNTTPTIEGGAPSAIGAQAGGELARTGSSETWALAAVGAAVLAAGLALLDRGGLRPVFASTPRVTPTRLDDDDLLPRRR